MGNLEMILTFIFAMTILMIPILAIARKAPHKALVENAELARRVNALELKQLERDSETLELRKEVAFMQRLIEDKAKGDGPTL
jgi:hypothetical protein